MSKLGNRYNKNKTRWSLLPWDAIERVILVYQFGAKKYSDRNWEQGLSYSDTFESLMRHITAWYNGEQVDPESGLSHLLHAAFNILALITFETRGVGKDDRAIKLNE